MLTDETKGMLLGLLGVTAFGLTLPVTRIVVPYLDPLFIGLGRAVVAAIVAAVILFIYRSPLPTLRQSIRLLVVSLGVIIGYPILSAWAMQYVHASHGGVVLGVLPLATAVFGAGISNERPSKGFWVIGLIGTSLVLAYSYVQAEGAFQAADLAMLGAVLFAAVGFAHGGLLSKEIGGWQTICWSLVLSLPFILIPTIFLIPNHVDQIPLSAWEGFLYLALFSQLFGFVFWNRGLALGGIARVSQMQLLQPFITIMASVLFLGEVLDAVTMVFAVMIVITIAISRMMPVRHI